MSYRRSNIESQDLNQLYCLLALNDLQQEKARTLRTVLKLEKVEQQ